jgi:hypothetical protein
VAPIASMSERDAASVEQRRRESLGTVAVLRGDDESNLRTIALQYRVLD